MWSSINDCTQICIFHLYITYHTLKLIKSQTESVHYPNYILSEWLRIRSVGLHCHSMATELHRAFYYTGLSVRGWEWDYVYAGTSYHIIRQWSMHTAPDASVFTIPSPMLALGYINRIRAKPPESFKWASFICGDVDGRLTRNEKRIEWPRVEWNCGPLNISLPISFLLPGWYGALMMSSWVWSSS